MIEKAKEASKPEPQTEQYFYPPQDERGAFVCEAASREEADALYSAAGNKE